MILTIASYGAALRKFGSCIEVEGRDEKQRVPADEVTSILLTSPCSLSSELISLCMERDISVTMLDHCGTPQWRAERFHGGITPLIRRSQMQLSATREGVLLAKALIRQKNDKRVAYLRRLASNRRNETGAELKRTCRRIEGVMSSLDRLESETVDTIRKKLMGYEGMAGSLYFRSLSSILPKDADFQKRERGNEAGPFNQMLNYGYGILYREIFSLCAQSGLDPYVGLLHTETYDRPVLVYDLVEPFRVVVEETVVKLFTLRKARREKILEQIPGGIMLSLEGKKLLISALEERMDGLDAPRKEMRGLVFDLARQMKSWKGLRA